EDEDDTKAGETEEEDEGGGGEDRRPQKREGDAEEGFDAASAKDRGRIFEARVEVRPVGADNPRGHGEVIEDMGDKDDPDRVEDLDRRVVQTEESRKDVIHEAVGAEQGGEGDRYDDGREDEGDGRNREEE